MTEVEIQALVGALAPVIRRHLEAAAAPILARVEALESRAPIPGPAGPQGEKGEAGVAPDAAAIAQAAGSVIQEAFAPLAGRVAILESRAPIPGPAGPQGEPGANAPSMAELETVIREVVTAIPVPKDGADGRDGVGLAGAVVDRNGHLVVTMTNGEAKDLGPVIGRDGADGAAGRDGFGFDDLEAGLEDDGRTLVLCFAKGDVQKEFRLALAFPIDRGVWKPGPYQRGDAVSWGGSMWIAQRDTESQPEKDDSWRLAVKRGRDGKDGVLKAPKEQGPVKVGA